MKEEKKEILSYNTKRNIIVGIILAVFSLAIVMVCAMLFQPNLSGFKQNVANLIWLSTFVFAIMMIFYAFVFYQKKRVYDSNKNLLVILTIIFVTIIASFSTMRYFDVYVVPLAMCGVLIGILVSQTIGYLANVFVSSIMMILYLSIQFLFKRDIDVNAIASIMIAMLSGFGMMFMVKKNYSRFKLLWGALAMGLLFLPLSVTSALTSYGYDIKVLYATLYCFAGSTIGVAIFTAILPIYESIFDVWTDFKLAEACSMSRPLLQRMSAEAGGTFNHSIQVSNICESCALAINENPYLAKAAAIYHDVGKLQNVEYFIENQKDGYNPHDDLIPEQSVKIITSHTTYGYKLLKEHHLPETVARVALEHHGTTPVTYFYNKAQNISEKTLDQGAFRYNSPKPTSKIAAIVLIVDIVEASTRASIPKDSVDLANRIEGIIASKIKENQFSDCNITFADLEKIKNTIIKVIPSIFHKRISYDNAKS